MSSKNRQGSGGVSRIRVHHPTLPKLGNISKDIEAGRFVSG